jgi:hypothetical protein
MRATARTQRRRARRKPAASSVIRIEMRDGMGNPRSVPADLIDIIDGGCGLKLMTPLQSGSIVIVRGKLSANHIADYLRAGVRWCIQKTDGTFRAGLQLLGSTFTPEEEQTHSITAGTPDCYEVMQLSPNADPDTISRVYRILAARYHPDNAETGNSEMFLRLSEAYQILSNPEKRALYDARHRHAKRLPWKNTGSEWGKRTEPDVRGTVYRRSGGEGEHFRSSVGALCGWNAALRRS